MTPDRFFERGRLQSSHPRAAFARESFLARIARLRGLGLENVHTTAFLRSQMEFHRAVAPLQMLELDGIADGFALDLGDIWLHLHAGTLTDLQNDATLDDGCSALAADSPADGPYVIKNRDLGGPVELVQIAQRHADSPTGGMVVLGSLIAPSAYSSGMNRAGLALADTHVPVRHHRVGWLRYLLMGHLLDNCGDLAQTLAEIRSHPHCGGGTLEIIDKTGAAAAIELASAGPVIETGRLSHARSNHYLRPETAEQSISFSKPEALLNSRVRINQLVRMTHDGAFAPDIKSARAMMSSHGGPGEEGLCQHRSSVTLSCAVYSVRELTLEWTDGSPCCTPWQKLQL